MIPRLAAAALLVIALAGCAKKQTVQDPVKPPVAENAKKPFAEQPTATPAPVPVAPETPGSAPEFSGSRGPVENVPGWRVQIFVSSSIENARKMAQEARYKFGDQQVYVREYAPLFKVQVGNSLSKQEAEPLKARAKSLGYSGAFIVEVDLTKWRTLPALIGFLAACLFAAAAPAADLVVGKAADPVGNDVSGDRQLVVIGQEVRNPLVVQVSNNQGKPAAGVKVAFEVVGQGVAVIDQAEALTDARGYARCFVKALQGPQPVYVTALAAANPGQRVVFTLQSVPPHWWIIAFLGAFGGLALFLFGLRFSSRGLQKAAGARLKQMLWSLTDNKLMGLGVGVLVTAIIQSSTATTVMLVTLTNAGLIGLGQVLGVILGADIGTTITVQLIAFKLSDYCLFFVAGGFVAMMAAGKKPWRYYPQIVFGFGLIFFGMKMTADALEPLKALPWFLDLFAGMAEQPLLGIFIGTAFTLVVRSSAATLGILLTLAFQGLVSLPAALPIIIGANVGTCGSALMAAWGGTHEAWRVAWGHVLFKVMAGLAAYLLLGPFGHLVSGLGGSTARQIANAHTLFNLAASLLFLPVLRPYERFIRKIIPESPAGQKTFGPKYLDERTLETPSLAIGQVAQEILRMADLVKDMLVRSMEVLEKNDISLKRQLVADDDKVDALEEAITPYVVKIAQEEMTGDQASRGVELLYIVNHLENIGDVISKNIMGHAGKKIEQQQSFSEEGLSDLRTIHRETLTTLNMAVGALASGDLVLAAQAHKRKDQVLAAERAMYKKHLERLQQGFKESRETSPIHLDILSDYERINFHASQIAAAVLGQTK